MSGDHLWAAVTELVERAPTIADLRSHGLELLAARRWRATGREVPDDIAQLEQTAAVVSLAAPAVLAQIRLAYDGPAILHKGVEVAVFYPDPVTRIFGDVDVLVPDAEEAQQALLAAGWEPTGDPELYVDIHHLRPLKWRDLPVVVEIHSRPKWVDRLSPPSVTELLERAVPSTVAEGFLALPPAEHALLLAAHSWAHEPLLRLRDLIDIAAVAGAAEEEAIEVAARRWGVAKVWRSTRDALESVLTSRTRPWSVRLWARNLPRVRERTVLEHHLERWLSDFWVFSPWKAAASLPRIFVDEVRPSPDETWNAKLRRTTRTMRNASRPRSEHRDELARTKRR